jgi:hypothetical protein
MVIPSSGEQMKGPVVLVGWDAVGVGVKVGVGGTGLGAIVVVGLGK